MHTTSNIHCLGNHDVAAWDIDDALQKHPQFGMQLMMDKLGIERLYYSFDCGRRHFVVIDKICLEEPGDDIAQVKECVGDNHMRPVAKRLCTGYRALLTVIHFVVISVLAFTACQAPQTADDMAERQAVVATRGVEVMPFDLERTTHIFDKQDDGGLQQVIADDADDEQIALIRAHLAEEAERFQQGDFHDPGMIHGEDMAGLHELTMGAARIQIVYGELPDGAQIRYTTSDPALVAAIHAWFDAQLADHGDHATGAH